MKKSKNQQLKDYIEYIWKEIIGISPSLVTFYEITYKNADHNGSNGEFAIHYEPTLFYASLLIFKDIFKEMPKRGLTKGFKVYIAKDLCHEAGHCYLWEFKGKSDEIEKKASLIGFLIFDILKGRGLIK